MQSGSPYRVVRIAVEKFDRLVLDGVVQPEDYELVKYAIKDERYPDDKKWIQAEREFIKARTNFNNETYRCRDENTTSSTD